MLVEPQRSPEYSKRLNLAARPSGCGCAAGVGPLACPRWWFGMPLSRHRVLFTGGITSPDAALFSARG
nr:E235 [uncultured bacterium]